MKGLHWGGTTARERLFNAAQKPENCATLKHALPESATSLPWGGFLWAEGSTGPRVLLVIDQPGWAFDNISRHIRRAFGGHYQFHSVYLCGSPSVSEFKWLLSQHQYDMVMFFWFGQYQKYRAIIESATKVCCLFYDDASLSTFEGSQGPHDDIDVVAASNVTYLNRLRSKGVPSFPCVDGVDTNVFRPTSPLSRTGKLRVLWTGFSNHGVSDLKGFWSIIDPLRQKMTNVEFIIRDRANGYHPHSSMPDWYNSGDVVICSSSAEGTPNPILEAAACGRPCITTQVGIVPQFVKANGFIVPRTVEAFEEAIQKLSDDRRLLWAMGKEARAASTTWDWSIQVQQFGKILEVAGPVKIPDFSGELTAVTITTGRDTFQDCQKALSEQTTTFRQHEVTNVHPMNKAFQTMLDSVTTPYFIQVDEDMVLYPDAADRMLKAIKATPATTWALAFPLFDTHLSMNIIGCKIYKTDIARQFPYQSSGSCEMDQVRRAGAAGLAMEVLPLDSPPVGEHRLGQNPNVIADRYYRLGRKQAQFHYQWLNDLPMTLKEHPTDVRTDALALIALLQGAADGPPTSESDFSSPLPPALLKAIKYLFRGELT